MSTIDKFINELKAQTNTSTVSNPYLIDSIADNLKIYLETMLTIKGKHILLAGEAPGYKGCKITGIPFTSGDVFQNVAHPLLMQLKDKLSLIKIEAENTATIVWNYLTTKDNTPLFWNSFPFHPHNCGNLNSNRAPNRAEKTQGTEYLKALQRIFEPEIVAGIGNVGVECAKKAFPSIKITYIRHPSFGGKSDFIKGMNEII
jgi:hypothetical protein